MASTDARPVPLKNTAYRVTFPLLDADGDLVSGAAGLDSEVSKDAGTFTDCTNEATEIASGSGMYYLDLTSTEMNADTVALIVKTSTTGAKTTPIVLYPQEVADLADVADAVWDEALSGHTTAGTAGKQLSDIATGTAPTVAAIADGVWDEVLSGHLTAGTTGAALNGASAPSAATIVDALYAKDMTTLTESAMPKRSLYAALAKLVNKVVATGGTMTVYRTDNTTPHYTQTETTDAAADPLTGLTGSA